jgi:hypothetical protein
VWRDIVLSVQDSNHNDEVFTMVWGTDINVTDVQQQFSQFVRGYRRQTGTTEDGVPILEDEAKYMAYLQDVRARLGICALELRFKGFLKKRFFALPTPYNLADQDIFKCLS